ncbi:unnamed protein product [Boreogadus saida]
MYLTWSSVRHSTCSGGTVQLDKPSVQALSYSVLRTTCLPCHSGSAWNCASATELLEGCGAPVIRKRGSPPQPGLFSGVSAASWRREHMRTTRLSDFPK